MPRTATTKEYQKLTRPLSLDKTVFSSEFCSLGVHLGGCWGGLLAPGDHNRRAVEPCAALRSVPPLFALERPASKD